MVTTCDRGYLCHIASPSIHPRWRPNPEIEWHHVKTTGLISKNDMISMRSPSENAINCLWKSKLVSEHGWQADAVYLSPLNFQFGRQL